MRIAAFATVLAATFTACWEDIPAGDYTSVYFWSDVMWNKYAAERALPVTEEGPGALETPRTVLLVTGVTIRAGWFDQIVERLERDGFVPVIYEPPELLSGNLFQASIELKEVVERVQQESGQDKIDILAECTSGLIARYYLQSLGGDEHVRSMVTFVSPQNGIAKAPLAADIAGWPALDDLSPGSAFLRAVNDAPLPDGVPITSIYTCTDEWIQPWETSVIAGAKNIGVGCNGGFVGHFQTFWDPSIYLLMHDALVAPTPAEEAAAEEPVDEPVEDPEEPVEEPVEDPEDPTEPVEGPTDVEDPNDPIETPNDGPSHELDPVDPEDPMTFEGEQPLPEAGLGCAGGGSNAGVMFALVGLALLALTARRKSADDGAA